MRLLDGDPWADAVALHRRLAYVPGDVTPLAQPHRRRGRSTCSAGCAGGADAARKAELLERFELDPTKKARTYSKGNRQKVALVAALAADVDLLVLDEPTAGLDPLMEEVFTECVARGARPRAGRCCSPATSSPRWRSSATRVTIIRNGRTVEAGTLGRAAAPDPQHRDRGDDRRSRRPGRSAGRARPRRRRRIGPRSWSTPARLDAVTGRLSALGLASLVCAPPSLEQLFLQHYGDQLVPAEVAAPR